MAIDTKLKNVGAAAAQLSQDLSFIERTQLNSIKNVGSITAEAGKLSSDVSGAVSRLTSAQNSAMQLGADLSSKLEGKGVFGKNAKNVISGAISSTVRDKIPMAQQFPKMPVDLSNWENRLPSNQFKTAAQKIDRAKEEILGIKDFRNAGITYPPDLVANAAAYVKLQFFKFSRVNAMEPGKVEDTEFVELPLPEDLTFSFNMKYQERDTGLYGDIINSATGQEALVAAEKARAAGGTALDQLSEAASAFGNSETLSRDIATNVGSALVRAGASGLESASDIAGGLAGQIIGAIPNPHPTVFFKGMELRSFNWTWKFVPRSKEEAEQLEAALKLIRKKVLPSKKTDGSSVFLQYPNMVQPQIKGDYTGLYTKFRKSMVSGFSIKYNAEGQSAYYVDGSPVSIFCVMQFQEVENYLEDTDEA